jgi:predicted methyltransferase
MKRSRVLFVGLWFAALGCESATPPVVAPPTVAPVPTTAATPAAEPLPVPAAIQAIVDNPDRTPEDKALDAGRHPGETLAFFDIKPGMKVAEIAAGGGYTTELLVRAVGPEGKVYGQNTKMLLEKFIEKPWSERLKRPIMKSVVRVDREFTEPFPPEATGLDAVFNVLFYHDLFWLKVDRAKMNAAVFAALRSGGTYAIIDHSGRAGTGSTEVQTLHRIEEKIVKEEVLAAGFKLVAEGAFLRNAADTRDWNAAPFAAAEKRGTSDRFVLKFVKP